MTTSMSSWHSCSRVTKVVAVIFVLLVAVNSYQSNQRVLGHSTSCFSRQHQNILSVKLKGTTKTSRRFQLSSSSSNENKAKQIVLTPSVVPSGLQEAASMLKSSLSQTLSQTPPKKLLSVDLLTPGLNPKLENKAILYQEYLFDIVTSIIPVITAQQESGKIRTAKFMFSSTGEAAGFQKYCYQMRIQIPEYLTLTDLDGRRITDDDDLIVFVAARCVLY
jgi:hypothetical protein